MHYCSHHDNIQTTLFANLTIVETRDANTIKCIIATGMIVATSGEFVVSLHAGNPLRWDIMIRGDIFKAWKLSSFLSVFFMDMMRKTKKTETR